VIITLHQSKVRVVDIVRAYYMDTM